jgi:hypothetical protein
MRVSKEVKRRLLELVDNGKLLRGKDSDLGGKNDFSALISTMQG